MGSILDGWILWRFGDSFLSRLHSNFNLLIWNCSEKSFLTETSLSKLNFVDFEFEQLIWIFAKDMKTRSRIVSISPPISLLQIDATRLIHSLSTSQYISEIIEIRWRSGLSRRVPGRGQKFLWLCSFLIPDFEMEFLPEKTSKVDLLDQPWLWILDYLTRHGLTHLQASVIEFPSFQNYFFSLSRKYLWSPNVGILQQEVLQSAIKSRECKKIPRGSCKNHIFS